MSRNGRILLIVAALVVAVAAFVLLRPSDDDDTDKAASTSTATTRTTETRPETETETAPARPAPDRITVRNGQPVGGVKKLTATRGDTVRLVVSSPDTSEEVHLHGYDISRNVAPNRPAAFRFKATIEGAFEIELEHTKVQIATLEVQPQ
jgi:heme/copper-type cytochrome/quinol oxidase subunit 2